jgi:membrane-bound lytic murein transglycosylase D
VPPDFRQRQSAVNAQAPRGDNREKPAAPPVTPPAATSAQNADERLLELFGKDLDKAVEQPRQRRRLQFSKDVVEHPRVRHFINLYSITQKNQFQNLLALSGRYVPMIARTLADEGLPEDLAYLALVESEFNLSATSQSGAVGLWQFVASTAKQYGLRIDDWVDERRDPVKATRAAAAYLKDLHNYYGRWYLATAAYNAGPGIINKALQTSRANDFWDIKQRSALSEETRNFVPKFVAVALIAANPKKYGFHNIQYTEPLDYDEVDAEGLLKVDAVAEMAQTDVATIRELNPTLLRNMTPPGSRGYKVRVPVGKGIVFARANDFLSNRDPNATQIVTHEVKEGDSLATIAKRYGQTLTALMEVNGLTTPRLFIGQKLQIILRSLRGTLR